MSERKVGERTHTVDITERTCDRCGAVIQQTRAWFRDEIRLERYVGEAFPEGNFCWHHRVDCCDECWPVLVEAVEAAGFTFWHSQAEDGPGEPPEMWRES